MNLYSVSDTYQEPIATFKYNNEDYLSTFNDMVYTYEQGNLKELKDNNSSIVTNYEYSSEKNNANVDLNRIIGNFEYRCEPYNPLFAPFGFYGKCSANLQSKEASQTYDFYFEYVYENDSKGRISMITRKCLDGVYMVGNVIHTTIFKVYYNE